MYKGYYVIDEHCHIFPDAIAQKATEATATRFNVKEYCRGTAGELSEMAGPMGIDLFIIEFVATKADQLKRVHEFVEGKVAGDPKHFVGLGTFHPDSKDPEGDVQDAVNRGFHGIKIHPDMQNHNIDDPGYCSLYEICAGKDFPIMIHTGDSRYDFSNPDRFSGVLKSFPKTSFVGAHFAGFSVWREAEEKLRRFENLNVDLSSTMEFTGLEELKRLINSWGCERVMYGSDYPMRKPNKGLDELFDMGFTDAQLRMLLSENSKRIFGI